LRLSRIMANLVGMTLFVQVILGGSAVVLGFQIIYHLIWGSVTFAVLVVAAILAVRDYGPKSTLFRVAIVANCRFRAPRDTWPNLVWIWACNRGPSY